MTDYPCQIGVIRRAAIIVLSQSVLLIPFINRPAHRRFVNLMA